MEPSFPKRRFLNYLLLCGPIYDTLSICPLNAGKTSAVAGTHIDHPLFKRNNENEYKARKHKSTTTDHMGVITIGEMVMVIAK
jgi:hypothetical protein